MPLLVVLGACVGSFVNVVVYRLPRGLSVWHPPSHCPHCQTRLRPWDNVPVLGWLWLGGRCRYCGGGISWRYPAVEAATAAWFALVGWRFEVGFALVGAVVLGAWLLALALIDRDTLTLPDGLLKSGLVLGLLWQCTQGWPGVVGGIGGMVLGLWLLDGVGWLASVLLGQTALGGGDPKLAAMLGVWLHWQLLLVALFIAVLTGAVAGVGGRLTGRLTSGQPMPFGPFLALGGGVALLFGADLWHWYWGWFS
ncbi:type 4 prepilin peptidase [Gloeomargarita lithophora Alchichica-D10]|uniref:Prepilin leader peptidase/N-methyltransferase n=2 Tax=Gloeomargarita TaxID=1188227 RepID=A0A1J0AH99_9CYAN|nr:type 4 prepilin peptidase [Gloeomargarita lithophora Alchichica-D10]